MKAGMTMARKVARVIFSFQMVISTEAILTETKKKVLAPWSHLVKISYTKENSKMILSKGLGFVFCPMA